MDDARMKIDELIEVFSQFGGIHVEAR